MTEKKYIIFNKPFGVLPQFTGEENQRTLTDFNLPKEIYAAGRLDKDSEGLLFLTNDGPLIHRLLHPQFHHPRTYWVQVEGQIDLKSAQQLAQGVWLKDFQTKKAEVKIFSSPPPAPERDPPIRYRAKIPTSWLEMTLYEGKNRQVRRMTATVGYPTLRLIRIAIARLTLSSLKPGEWREVSSQEIRSVSTQIFLW